MARPWMDDNCAEVASSPLPPSSSTSSSSPSKARKSRSYSAAYTWQQGFEWTIILLSGIYLHHYHHPLIPILIPEPDQILLTWERWKTRRIFTFATILISVLIFFVLGTYLVKLGTDLFKLGTDLVKVWQCQTMPTEGWTNFGYLHYHHPHLCPKTWPILSN